MAKHIIIEQVKLPENVAKAMLEEAQRQGVSRSQIGREAIMDYLGFKGEGSKEPAYRWNATRNWGRK